MVVGRAPPSEFFVKLEMTGQDFMGFCVELLPGDLPLHVLKGEAGDLSQGCGEGASGVCSTLP